MSDTIHVNMLPEFVSCVRLGWGGGCSDWNQCYFLTSSFPFQFQNFSCCLLLLLRHSQSSIGIQQWLFLLFRKSSLYTLTFIFRLCFRLFGSCHVSLLNVDCWMQAMLCSLMCHICITHFLLSIVCSVQCSSQDTFDLKQLELKIACD